MHFRCVYGAIFSTVQYCAKTLFISLLCAMEMGNVSSSLEHVNKHGNTVFKVKKKMVCFFPMCPLLTVGADACVRSLLDVSFLKDMILVICVENLKGPVLRCNLKKCNAI